ncbi:MAG: hypothetical protein HFE44_07875 [Oscillospiraceae bacterium]|nr:hypothetical protein [Oscillospiraceae bacterium]
MLKPDKTRTENGVTVHEKLIPDSARANKYCASWCKQGEPMKPCRPLSYGMTGVTIHNTQDLPGVEDDAEQYTRATWPNCNMGGVVVLLCGRPEGMAEPPGERGRLARQRRDRPGKLWDRRHRGNHGRPRGQG